MTPAQIAKIMSLVDDYAAACFNFSVHGPQQGAARAAVEAALRDAPQAERTLTDEQIKRHSLLAADCPGASTVILVSSLRRLLSRPSAPTAVEPDERAEFEAWFKQGGDYDPDWLAFSNEVQGQYSNQETQNMWDAWQAAIASKGKK